MLEKFDVTVIGGGPAGLNTAKEMASSGKKITLVDENNSFGGSLPEDTGTIDGRTPCNWLSETLNALSKYQNLKMLTRTTVYGYSIPFFLLWFICFNCAPSFYITRMSSVGKDILYFFYF